MPTIPAWCAVVCRAVDTPPTARLLSALQRQGVPARALRTPELLAAAAERRAAPAVVLSRLPSGTPGGELDALLALEASGPAWINRPSALGRAHDKARALTVLASAGLPVPPTLCLLRDDPRGLDALPDERLVVKPTRGAAGRGVILGLDRQAALASARAFADLCGAVLVQAERGDGIELRVFVVEGRCVAAMERVPARAGARASMHYGARARAASPAPALVDLGLAAAAALQLDVAGVDLVHDAHGPCVLEVNACPGLTAIEASTGQDVAGEVAALARRVLGSATAASR